MYTLTRPLIVLVAILLLLTGCTKISFTQPVGTPDAEAAANLRGTWVVNDEMVIYIQPAGEGKILFALVNKDGENGFKLEQYSGTVTRLGDDKALCFLHLPAEDPAKAKASTRVTITRIRLDDDKAIAWAMSAEELKKAIESKALPGTVATEGEHNTHIKIDADKATLDAYFKAQEKTLFNLEQPLVAHRISQSK